MDIEKGGGEIEEDEGRTLDIERGEEWEIEEDEGRSMDIEKGGGED